MDEKWNSRTEILIGKQGIEKLEKAKIIIYGIGGVGSYTTEALARAGIGNLILVDNDKITPSNINRQIHATTKTVGKNKVDVMKKRIEEINPNANVQVYMNEENEENLINTECSYVVDAVDTIKTKLTLIEKANEIGVPIISAMGAGNKLDATKFEVSDIYKTSECPLAKVMRKELKKRNIEKLKVVYSKEKPIEPKQEVIKTETKKVKTKEELLGKGVKAKKYQDLDFEELSSHISKIIDTVKNVIPIMEENLKESNMDGLLYHIEMPLVEVLADMEYEGIKVDKEKLNELGLQFKEIIKKLESEIYEISGEKFNINSPKQLGVIL